MAEYLTNAALAAEILACQTTMIVSDRLARMLVLMVARIALKPSFRSYSFIQDMKAEAVWQLIKCNESSTRAKSDTRPNILKFDFRYSERKGLKPNPFSYSTTIILNVFRRCIKLESSHAALRDEIMVGAGMTPSTKRQLADEANRSSDPIPPRVRRVHKPHKRGDTPLGRPKGKSGQL